MSATKRISGDYSIVSINKTVLNDGPGFSTVSIDTNLVDINGDLRVTGMATFIDKQDVDISDNTIILNKGEINAGVTTTYSGLEIDRGTLNNSDLLWDETLDQWTVDLGDGARKNVLTAFAWQGPALHNILEDLTPQLGGDLDVNGMNITALINEDIVLVATGAGNIQLKAPVLFQGPEPATVETGDTAVFPGVDTGGGTQLHYKNDTTTGELVSKTKSIVFALIF